MAPKAKDKVHQPPTRFSLRFAALKTRQSRDKVGPSRTAPINAKPIEISSDSESKEVLEYILGTGQSDDEVPEYIPDDWPAENQSPREEEPKGPAEEPEEEEDPKEVDPEEAEEQVEENEMGEEEVKAVEPSDDEYQEYFADYFELAPPTSPDSSDDSIPPADD
ncbi:hypothetical protein PIB30_066799 [Stylosanthes scabra]|uniref:Uncharacterized protein n=1 Tax=Stylosanthes scabra TaxID=79078 RepID=A0ABU6ZL28_9FABA|nr:hypothetical protein [Stylosanthes scabra]